ncbi:unnamed protein product [Cunninghamella blakesleeana]
MRSIKKVIDKEGHGEITLIAEELEDMWHVYNLIMKGNHIKATTIRRLQSESSTGSMTSQRIRLTLTISVETMDFDPLVGLLRINGRVTSENPYVKMGSYHTIDLELNHNFTIIKDEWDSLALERVEEACDITKQADVAAVVCQEGLANLCFLTKNMTIVKQRIETPIPRKRKGSTANHDKVLTKFYDQIYNAIIRTVDFNITKAIIIASPGFVKDQVYQYIFEQAVKSDNKLLFDNKHKFLLIHCSSGHKHSLNEVMQEPSVMAKLADTKAVKEVNALDAFYQMLNKDPDRAFYGYDHVSKAHELGAISTLLVSDGLLRSVDMATRKKYVKLVEEVRENNGEVYIFSSLHVSGEQLSQLTGVAAILTFPVPDIDDEDENENNEE